MKYTARKMGSHAASIPDAHFETWDGKVIRVTPEYCWMLEQDIKDIVEWAKQHFWALSISNHVNAPPMMSAPVRTKRILIGS